MSTWLDPHAYALQSEQASLSPSPRSGWACPWESLSGSCVLRAAAGPWCPKPGGSHSEWSVQPGPWDTRLSEAQGVILAPPSCRGKRKNGGGRQSFVQPEAVARTQPELGQGRYYLGSHKDNQDSVLVFAVPPCWQKSDGCHSVGSHRLKGVLPGLWG